MRWISALVLGLACGVAGSCLDASPGRADDASRAKLARDVVETAHVGDNMRAVMPLMMTQMKTLLMQQGTTGPDQVDLYLKRFQSRFDAQIPQFSDLVAEVYAKEFSEEDLAALLVFYRTSAGQHLLQKQPEIAKGMMLVGQRWGQGIAQEVIAELAKERAAVPPPKL